MVDCQIHPAGIIMPEILEAFSTIPRERFLPEAMRDIAYSDAEIEILPKRRLIEPMVHAKLIQAATPRPEDVALDVGCANGYSSAILSGMVTTVIALDNDQSCLERASRTWEDLGVCNVVAMQGDLPAGSPEHAPFDIIFLNGAVSGPPEALIAQLAPETGRLVAIIEDEALGTGKAMLFQSLGQNQFSSYTLFDASCAFLPGFSPNPVFKF